MNYKIAQNLPAMHFKQWFGVQFTTFKQLIKALKGFWRPTPKPGSKTKLRIEYRVLVCLEKGAILHVLPQR